MLLTDRVMGVKKINRSFLSEKVTRELEMQITDVFSQEMLRGSSTNNRKLFSHSSLSLEKKKTFSLMTRHKK